jgi:hypothetical protein
MRDLALLSLFKSSAVVEFCLEYKDKEVERELIGLDQDEFFEKVKEMMYNILKESDLDSCARTFYLHPKFLYQMISRKAIGNYTKEKEIRSENNLEGLGKESRFRIGRKVDLCECQAIYASQSIRPKQRLSQGKHPSKWPSVSKTPFSQKPSRKLSCNHHNLDIKPPSDILKKAWYLLADLP